MDFCVAALEPSAGRFRHSMPIGPVVPSLCRYLVDKCVRNAAKALSRWRSVSEWSKSGHAGVAVQPGLSRSPHEPPMRSVVLATGMPPADHLF